ncbi:tetraspanin-10 isoform X2 [Camelus ferus]|uniref:Tetraspanin-10 n=1 Tax=Camelus ferus TaxID=419612 RepID=A0A8B6Y6W2_CAMFR|nr:tetraspanin-10 isoform X2 [Camelus ferus]
MTVASRWGSQLPEHGQHQPLCPSHRGQRGTHTPVLAPVHLSWQRMDEGERRPLLSQDARDQEPALTRSSPLTPVPPGPAPWEDQARGEGLGGVLAHSLPCLKGLIFLSNFLFSLLSLLALAVGLWGLAVKGSLGTSWGGPLPADLMLGLVLGGLAVSVVSLAGCLGALCENAFLLHCFSGGVLAFLVLEAMAGALLVALWGRLQDGLEHVLRAAITHYQDDPDLCFLIDQVQLGLQCCGAASYQDWQHNLHFNCSSPGVQACSLPASCCIDPWKDGASVNDQCGFRALGLDEDAAQRVVHLQGCGPPLRQWLRSHVWTAGKYAIVVVVVQGAELLLAIQLVRALAVHKGAAGRAGLPSRPPGLVPHPLPNGPPVDWWMGRKTRTLERSLGLQASLPLSGKVSE